MAYYLQMDGVDDYLQAPSITFDKIVIDGVFNTSAAQQYITHITAGGSGYSRIQAGASVAAYNAFTGTGFIISSRSTHEISRSPFTASASNLRFCASNIGTAFARADLYDIKYYNGATLQAHYDMTLGNVLDQSGNGNHATLTGGTWVAGGATGTVGSVSYATKQIINQVGSVSVATKQVISLVGTQDVATKQIISAVGSTAFSTKQTIYQITAVQMATKQRLYTISSSQWATKQMFGVQLARLINLLGSKPDPIRLLGESIAPINLLGSSIDSIALQGSKPAIIALEGGIMATKTAQNFTMYAGDTPPFTITMSDSTSLSGATLKWAVRKGHVKGALVISKDTLTSGLTVSGYVVTVVLIVADTSALEGKYYHEMELTDVSGNVSTVSIGEITILPSGV